MKRVAWLIGIICTFVAFWMVSSSLAGEGAKPRTDGDFVAKVLVVFCKNSENNAVLGDVSVRQLGNRTFLRGKILSRNGSESAWTAAMHWIPIDEVTAMYEFNTIEEAKKAQEESESRRGPKQ